MNEKDILEITPIPVGHTTVCHKEIDRLIEMTEKITVTDGSNQTSIPFLRINRNSHETPSIPAVLSPSFCLVLRGRKKIHLGQKVIYAHPGDYMASLIDIPSFIQVIDATDKAPYICLRIDLSINEIASVVLDADIKMNAGEKKPSPGTFIGKADTDLLELFTRLLKLVDRPQNIRYLSSLIKREMIFHLLSGDCGHLFLQRAFFDQQGIGKAIAWMKNNYSQSFTMEELAASINMSASGLQHKFKAITTMGPLQYQKQLRLQEARRLMMNGIDVTNAAMEVGYGSATQFSREYRRLFGQPPLKDMKELQVPSISNVK